MACVKVSDKPGDHEKANRYGYEKILGTYYIKWRCMACNHIWVEVSDEAP